MIVLIDDDPDVCRGLERLLRAHRFSVKSFTNPRQALLELAAIKPQAVILDMRMPQMTGIDVLRSIRTHPALSHLPVAIYTAESDAHEDEAKALGIAGYWIKGKFSPDEVVSELARMTRTPTSGQ